MYKNHVVILKLPWSVAHSGEGGFGIGKSVKKEKSFFSGIEGMIYLIYDNTIKLNMAGIKKETKFKLAQVISFLSKTVVNVTEICTTLV